MLSKATKNLGGPLLVGTAAFLWATDALIRYPAIGSVDPTFIVFVEHVLAFFILLPWMLYKYKNQLFSLNSKEWISAIFSGVGGSALGTVFFTASFLYINPSVAVLLQKLQPIMVVLIAYLFLGEKPMRKFYIWGVVALFAGVVLSFPDFNFRFLSDGLELRSKGIHYAFGAAFLWAASTVSGKILLKRTPASLAIFWRFTFGMIALAILMALAKQNMSWHAMKDSTTCFSILYLSLIPGLFGMCIYYLGLSRTPAGVTTFIELLYPIGAVVLNTIFLHTPLEPVQIGAGLLLVLAVGMISF